VRELDKLAGQNCRFIKFKRGCTVYASPVMPNSCKLWSCRWLVDPEAIDLPRPDRSGYVVDLMPDFVMAQDNETGEEHRIEVVQVWVDPARFRSIHDHPALKIYLNKVAENGIAALLRFDSQKAIAVLPPAMTGGVWHVQDGTKDREHTIGEILGYDSH
jgi:hypothetical protein